MKKTYSIAVANVIKKYLDDNGWKYQFEEENGMFFLEIALRNKIKTIVNVVDVKEEEYLVYGIVPFNVDAKDHKKMSMMAEFLCRINRGLKNGNFELDYSDGEIRYKCFVDCDGNMPSDHVIQKSIVCPAMMVDRFSEGILGLVFGNADVEEAMKVSSPAWMLKQLLLGEDSKQEENTAQEEEGGIVLDTSDISAGGHFA